MSAGAEASLAQLTKVNVRRYLTHPVFLVGAVALTGGLWQSYAEPDRPGSQWDNILSYALFLGGPGLIVGYRLTVTEGKALKRRALTADAVTRTKALYLACLVPLAATLVFMAAYGVVNGLSPRTEPIAGEAFILRPSTGEISWFEYLGWVIELPVVSFGGAVLGVTVGKWLRFRGAGVLALFVVLVVELVGMSVAERIDIANNPAVRMMAAALPWVYWKIGTDERVYTTMRDGSPVGHLLYALCLSGLAVVAGLLKEAPLGLRARLMRVAKGLAGVAAAAWVWTVLG